MLGCAPATGDGGPVERGDGEIRRPATVDDDRILAEWRAKLARIANVEGLDVIKRVWIEIGYMPVLAFGGSTWAGGDWELYLESSEPDFTEPFLRHDDGRKIELSAPVFALFTDESTASEEPLSMVGESSAILVGTPDLLVVIDPAEDTFGRVKRQRPVRSGPPPDDVSFEKAVRRVRTAHRTLPERLERRMRDDLKCILDQPSDEGFEAELATRLGVRIPKTVDGAYPLRGGWRLVDATGTPRFDGPAGEREPVPPSVFVRFFSDEAGMTRSAAQESDATTTVCVGTPRHVLLVDSASGAVRRIAR